MPLIIDGYNLLNAAGILPRGVGPATLERARLALLNFLAESLQADELAQTVVVFDAAEPPAGARRELVHRGLEVRFAARGQDADTLIERLIRLHSAPRRLTVVSSDHRLQRAARRRRAAAVDSDVWYAEIVRQRELRRQSRQAAPERPPVPLLAEDVDYWVRRFGGDAALAEWVARCRAEEDSAARPAPAEGAEPETPSAPEPLSSDKPSPAEAAGLDQVFPPDYADDLIEGTDLEDYGREDEDRADDARGDDNARAQ